MNKFALNLNNFSLFNSANFVLDTTKQGFLLIDKNGSGKTSILNALHILFTGKDAQNNLLKNYINISLPNNTYFKIQFANYSHHLIYAVNTSSGYYEKKIKTDKVLPVATIFTYFSKYNNWLNFERSKKLSLLDNYLALIFEKPFTDDQKNLKKYLNQKTALIAKYNKKFKQFQKQGISFNNQSIESGDLLLLNNINTHIYKFSISVWQARDTFFGYLASNLLQFQKLINTKINTVKLRLYKTDLNGNRSPFFNYEKEIYNQKLLETLFLKEIIIGRNLFGATRDDFNIEINSKNISDILSTGENRLFILFFIKQFICLFKLSYPNKVIWWFLDDCFNELDAIREEKIYKHLLFDLQFWFATGTKIPAFYIKNKSLISLSKV